VADGTGDGEGVLDGAPDGAPDATGVAVGVLVGRLDGTVPPARTGATGVPLLPLQPPNNPAKAIAKTGLRRRRLFIKASGAWVLVGS
jgi:hypothetical protein